MTNCYLPYMAVHYAIDIFIPWLAHTELYPRENWPLFLWHKNGCNQKCWSYTRMIQDLFTVYRLTSEKLCLSKLIFSNWTNLLEGAASLVYIVGAVGGLHRYFSRVWHIFFVCLTAYWIKRRVWILLVFLPVIHSRWSQVL